ncbi:ABC transporter substrate-binding protein [Lacticaseibacillus hegangensis]|uniref:ABC transporter substrate-binding protein n=1 Tax=Lacticaseibacillus hegangensis TaxID=2486010 RepID=A0ABW4CTX4_9LACO|nr:sugar ABC transporter substrate-binding protein [Lacticaseibacillus hegangensis]
MKKKFLFGLTLVASLCLMILSGCGSSSASKQTSAKSKQTITFWTMELKPTFTKYFKGVIAQYEKENPNITIKWQDLPQASLQNKLLATTAGGKAPDVVNSFSELTMALASKGALANMDKLMTKKELAVYNKNLLDTGRYRDNTLYALPWYHTPEVQLYNKDLFAKAGLTPPQTYADVVRDSKTMKDKTGAFLYTPNFFQHILTLNNIPVISKDGKKAVFNNKQSLKILTQLTDLVKKGEMSKTGWGSWQAMENLYAKEKVATVTSGPQVLANVKSNSVNEWNKSAAAQTVADKKGGLVMSPVQDIVVPATSEHQKAAAKFALYLTNTANEVAFCKQATIFPTTNKALKDPYFTSDTKTLEGQLRAEGVKASLHISDAVLKVPNATDIVNTINSIPDAVYTDGKTPKQALKDAEVKVDKYLKNN